MRTHGSVPSATAPSRHPRVARAAVPRRAAGDPPAAEPRPRPVHGACREVRRSSGPPVRRAPGARGTTGTGAAPTDAASTGATAAAMTRKTPAAGRADQSQPTRSPPQQAGDADQLRRTAAKSGPYARRSAWKPTATTGPARTRGAAASHRAWPGAVPAGAAPCPAQRRERDTGHSSPKASAPINPATKAAGGSGRYSGWATRVRGPECGLAGEQHAQGERGSDRREGDQRGVDTEEAADLVAQGPSRAVQGRRISWQGP